MNRIKKAFSHTSGEIRGGLGQLFSKFKIKTGYLKSREFFESNSLVAKLAFLILMLVLVTIVISVGLRIISSVFAPSKDPSFWIKTKCNNSLNPLNKCARARYQPDATQGNTWFQDESLKECQQPCSSTVCQTVLRSRNERYGTEFTWSIWINIKALKGSGSTRQHIFSKGSDTVSSDSGTTGMMSPNNAPGLYLDATKNAVWVVMNTFDMIDEEVEVNDIPLNKWVNIIIRNEGNTLDVYVNGTIAIRHRLSSVPKQNYGDVHATKNGGFNGSWSLLHYYNRALNTTEIMNIVRAGPDLRTCVTDPIVPPYLSMQWYFDNSQD